MVTLFIIYCLFGFQSDRTYKFRLPKIPILELSALASNNIFSIQYKSNLKFRTFAAENEHILQDKYNHLAFEVKLLNAKAECYKICFFGRHYF